MIATAIFLVLMTGCVQTSMARWTSYEQDFAFECPSLYRITSLKSEYNGRNDRKWEFGCTKGFVGQDCAWSEDKIEKQSGEIFFYCPGPVNNKKPVLTGIKSRFNGGRRIWNFNCCKINTKAATDCKHEPQINQPGQPLNKVLPADRAIILIGYERPAGTNDRRWWMWTCSYMVCKVKKLNILDAIRAAKTNAGQKIIGIAVDQTCSSDTSTLRLYRTDTVQKTTGLSFARGAEFNWGATVTVGAEVSAGFLGTGATASFSLGVSVGGAITAERVDSEETSVGSEDSAGKDLSYTGPGAAIIIGTVDKYKLNTNNINVEITSACDDGTEWKERRRMNLSQTSYGKAFFRSRRATFSPGMCGQESEDCISRVRGENAYDPSIVFRDFSQCVAGRGTVSRI